MTKYLTAIKVAILAFVAFFLYKKGKESEELKTLKKDDETKDRYEDINAEYVSYDDVYLASNWMHNKK